MKLVKPFMTLKNGSTTTANYCISGENLMTSGNPPEYIVGVRLTNSKVQIYRIEVKESPMELIHYVMKSVKQAATCLVLIPKSTPSETSIWKVEAPLRA